MRFWIKSWSKKVHSSPRRGIEFRCPAWQTGILPIILLRNYVSRSFAYRFSASFQRCFSNEILNQKKCIPLLGGELNPGLPRDRRGYLPLYYRGTALQYHLRAIFQQVSKGVFKWNPKPKKVYSCPRRALEPRSLAWQVGILITILQRNYMFRFLCGPSFTKCGFE